MSEQALNKFLRGAFQCLAEIAYWKGGETKSQADGVRLEINFKQSKWRAMYE
jgi:hypothetical protein